jgi:cytochrome P450
MTSVTTSPRPPALLSPAFFADPYPTYHALRAADPVMWDETLHSWVLSGYAEVATALNDGRLVRGLTAETQTVILDKLDASGQGGLRPLRKLL